MLISKSKSLTIQVTQRLKLVVFTWRGFTPSEVFQGGMIQSLEVLRVFPEIHRIILNVKDHHMVMQKDIDASVNSTVDYLGVADGNYKMAMIPPDDILAKAMINHYMDSLNKTLKNRFVVRKFETMKHAFSWLTKPAIFSFFILRSGGRKSKNSMIFS
jgi:hypothetical protein